MKCQSLIILLTIGLLPLHNEAATINFTTGNFKKIYTFITKDLATKDYTTLETAVKNDVNLLEAIKNTLNDILNNYISQKPLSSTSIYNFINKIDQETKDLFNNPSTIQTLNQVYKFTGPTYFTKIPPEQNMTIPFLLPYLSYNVRKNMALALTKNPNDYLTFAQILVNHWHGALGYCDNDTAYTDFYKDKPDLMAKVLSIFYSNVSLEKTALPVKNFLKIQILKHINYIAGLDDKTKSTIIQAINNEIAPGIAFFNVQEARDLISKQLKIPTDAEKELYNFIAIRLASEPEISLTAQLASIKNPKNKAIAQDILKNYKKQDDVLTSSTTNLLNTLDKNSYALFKNPQNIDNVNWNPFIPDNIKIPADLDALKISPYVSFNLRESIANVLKNNNEFSIFSKILVNLWHGALGYSDNYENFYKDNPPLIARIISQFLTRIESEKTNSIKNFLEDHLKKHISYIENFSNAQKKDVINYVLSYAQAIGQDQANLSKKLQTLIPLTQKPPLPTAPIPGIKIQFDAPPYSLVSSFLKDVRVNTNANDQIKTDNKKLVDNYMDNLYKLIEGRDQKGYVKTLLQELFYNYKLWFKDTRTTGGWLPSAYKHHSPEKFDVTKIKPLNNNLAGLLITEHPEIAQQTIDQKNAQALFNALYITPTINVASVQKFYAPSLPKDNAITFDFLAPYFSYELRKKIIDILARDKKAAAEMIVNLWDGVLDYADDYPTFYTDKPRLYALVMIHFIQRISTETNAEKKQFLINMLQNHLEIAKKIQSDKKIDRYHELIEKEITEQERNTITPLLNQPAMQPVLNLFKQYNLYFTSTMPTSPLLFKAPDFSKDPYRVVSSFLRTVGENSADAIDEAYGSIETTDQDQYAAALLKKLGTNFNMPILNQLKLNDDEKLIQLLTLLKSTNKAYSNLNMFIQDIYIKPITQFDNVPKEYYEGSQLKADKDITLDYLIPFLSAKLRIHLVKIMAQKILAEKFTANMIVNLWNGGLSYAEDIAAYQNLYIENKPLIAQILLHFFKKIYEEKNNDKVAYLTKQLDKHLQYISTIKQGEKKAELIEYLLTYIKSEKAFFDINLMQKPKMALVKALLINYNLLGFGLKKSFLDFATYPYKILYEFINTIPIENAKTVNRFMEEAKKNLTGTDGGYALSLLKELFYNYDLSFKTEGWMQAIVGTYSPPKFDAQSIIPIRQELYPFFAAQYPPKGIVPVTAQTAFDDLYTNNPLKVKEIIELYKKPEIMTDPSALTFDFIAPMISFGLREKIIQQMITEQVGPDTIAKVIVDIWLAQVPFAKNEKNFYDANRAIRDRVVIYISQKIDSATDQIVKDFYSNRLGKMLDYFDKKQRESIQSMIAKTSPVIKPEPTTQPKPTIIDFKKDILNSIYPFIAGKIIPLEQQVNLQQIKSYMTTQKQLSKTSKAIFYYIYQNMSQKTFFNQIVNDANMTDPGMAVSIQQVLAAIMRETFSDVPTIASIQSDSVDNIMDQIIKEAASPQFISTYFSSIVPPIENMRFSDLIPYMSFALREQIIKTYIAVQKYSTAAETIAKAWHGGAFNYATDYAALYKNNLTFAAAVIYELVKNIIEKSNLKDIDILENSLNKHFDAMKKTLAPKNLYVALNDLSLHYDKKTFKDLVTLPLGKLNIASIQALLTAGPAPIKIDFVTYPYALIYNFLQNVYASPLTEDPKGAQNKIVVDTYIADYEKIKSSDVNGYANALLEELFYNFQLWFEDTRGAWGKIWGYQHNAPLKFSSTAPKALSNNLTGLLFEIHPEEKTIKPQNAQELFDKLYTDKIKNYKDALVYSVEVLPQAENMHFDLLAPYISFALREKIINELGAVSPEATLLEDTKAIEAANLIVNLWYGGLEYSKNYESLYKNNVRLAAHVLNNFCQKISLLKSQAQKNYVTEMLVKHTQYIKSNTDLINYLKNPSREARYTWIFQVLKSGEPESVYNALTDPEGLNLASLAPQALPAPTTPALTPTPQLPPALPGQKTPTPAKQQPTLPTPPQEVLTPTTPTIPSAPPAPAYVPEKQKPPLRRPTKPQIPAIPLQQPQKPSTPIPTPEQIPAQPAPIPSPMPVPLVLEEGVKTEEIPLPFVIGSAQLVEKLNKITQAMNALTRAMQNQP